MSTSTIRTAVEVALDAVVDPCSNAQGTPLGLAEMGLVTSISVEDGNGEVHVTLTMTSPCCAYGPALAEAARAEIATIPGVSRAIVTIDHDAVWTPEQMTSPARVELARRRRRIVELGDLRPYDWTGSANK